ncbi:DUF5677 domain-containing protein [Lonepinella sp. MS14435]|uniref:DUF5677 domain-containing protein n=1 Tax=Lonepinella sp. MS14435 TaxID=3003618 RepID=UPI0036D78037
MSNYDDKKQIYNFNSYIEELKNIGNEILALKDEFQNLTLDMSDNINYVSKVFSMRQFEQLQAMFDLNDNESIILIARSMFEGSVYLSAFLKDKKLINDWRNYSYVVDKKRFDELKEKEEEIPEEVREKLESKECKKIIAGFNNKRSWKKDKSIKELAKIAELTHFYEIYYDLMSDYHHFGTKSFGIRYKCGDLNVIRLDTAEIKLESLNAWCLAISSVLLSLKILSMETSLFPKIELLYEEITNLPFVKITSINYKI